MTGTMGGVTFVEHNGTERQVEVADGTSLMQAALDHSVPGILGDCGGNLTCATCHGYVDEAWQAKLAPPSKDEIAMLEFAVEPRPNSRLTCQIKMSAAIDGIVVQLPESQT